MRSDTPLLTALNSFFVSNYDLAPKTKAFYRQNITAFDRFIRESFGREAMISDLQKDYAEHYLAKVTTEPTAKYPKGSVFRARAAAVSLKRLANWFAEIGVQADRLGNSLLRSVKRTKVPDNVRPALTEEELDAILTAYRPGTVEYTVIVLMLGTGLRFNEAREMLVGDVDIGNGLLTVRPVISKSKELRTVDVHDAVLKELDRYLRQRDVCKSDQPLFLTDEGKPFSEDGFDKLFRRIRRESGVSHFHAHLARHTWATRFKGDILELKRQGGWKDWKQVERYRHGQRPARENLVNPLDLKRTLVSFKRASA
jgi:integrase